VGIGFRLVKAIRPVVLTIPKKGSKNSPVLVTIRFLGLFVCLFQESTNNTSSLFRGQTVAGGKDEHWVGLVTRKNDAPKTS